MSLLPAFRPDASLPDQGIPRSLFGYDVLDYIGEGAGSIIYVVTEPGSRQIYALKHVVRKTEKDIRFVEQLEAEYEVGKHLKHPNLRRIFEFKCNRTVLRK